MTYIEELAAIGPRKGVWQIVPPSDYRDRMAEEGPPATPQGGYPLTNHGGSTIPNPQLALVFLGPWWSDETKLASFANDLMTAGYLQPLADYSYGSGQGSFAGTFQGPTVTGTVTDAQLQGVLGSMIQKGQVPPPTGSLLYALILPDGVTVDQGGSASCSAFCGYHDAFGVGGKSVFYTVQPATGCRGCNTGDPFAAFTAVLAHEIAEACTDAIPGEGWYNDQTGMENADEWAWVFGPYGPWTVQGYQVNGVGNSLGIIKYQQPNPNPNPNPNPQPQPQPQPKNTDRFWSWLAAVGEWALQVSEASRTAEVPTVDAQLEHFYPNVASLAELADAPLPPEA